MQSLVITNFCSDSSLADRLALEPYGNVLYRSDTSEAALRGNFLKKYYKEGSFVGIRPKVFWPEAVFFDMDSTLIEEESGVVLAESLGIQEKVELMTEAAMRGEVSFEESFRERLRLYKGLSMTKIAETFSQLHLSRGVSEFCFWLRQKRIPIFVVSGGFSIFSEYIAQVIGADAWSANKVDIVDDKLTGEIKGRVLARKDKKIWLEKICQERSINLSRTVMIGDGANDKDILETAGIAVGFMPKAILHNSIHVYNGTGSHEFMIDFFQESNHG